MIFDKVCGRCSHYHAPPDTFKGRVDIGYCEIVGGGVMENEYYSQWKCKGTRMKDSMKLYRQILCYCLGGLDNYDERRMVAYLLAMIARLEDMV